MMGNFDKERFASNNQEFETPKHLYDLLDSEFHFTLDSCASDINHKHTKYYTKENSLFEHKLIGEVFWMNPPYKDMQKFIQFAHNECLLGATGVLLIPARTNTKWWHKYCMTAEVRFICGRPKFVGCKHGLPQPLALVIFRKENKPKADALHYSLQHQLCDSAPSGASSKFAEQI